MLAPVMRHIAWLGIGNAQEIGSMPDTEMVPHP